MFSVDHSVMLMSLRCTETENHVKIHNARAFSRPITVIFANGQGETKGNCSDAALKLDLVHDECAKWSDMKDVRVFVYQVVGHYSPPLPEDKFQRLDEEQYCEDAEYRTNEQMQAEEDLVGLRLLHVGSIKVSTLVENRSRPAVNRTQTGGGSGENSDNMSFLNDVSAWSNRGAVSRCAMQTFDGLNAHDAVGVPPISEVVMTTDATRVLPPDSRFDCMPCDMPVSTQLLSPDARTRKRTHARYMSVFLYQACACAYLCDVCAQVVQKPCPSRFNDGAPRQ